jgi:hypothetical protein
MDTKFISLIKRTAQGLSCDDVFLHVIACPGMFIACDISGSDGSKYKDDSLLGYSTMLSH